MMITVKLLFVGVKIIESDFDDVCNDYDDVIIVSTISQSRIVSNSFDVVVAAARAAG